MPTNLAPEEIALRLFLAMVLSLVIGWERESRDKPAGLRTHMLVGVGSAAFLIVATEVILGPLTVKTDLTPDPTRIIQGVIGGIGFLGAGSIIQARGNVEGMTTGAGIWVVGAIGLACGGGFYIVAGILAGFILFILLAVGFATKRFKLGRQPVDGE